MSLTLAVGLLNLGLGIVYTNYGTMTAIELRRGWRTRGFSHFGAAWILMAFTCGPHHLAHASHLLFEGRAAGSLDLFAVAIGVPAGVTWFVLRIEAFAGGRGDRFVQGTPVWVVVSGFAAIGYAVAMHGVFAYYVLTSQYGFDSHGFSIDWLAVPAAAYFLWVVRGLYDGRVRDWNSNTSTATRREVEPAPAQA